MFDAPFDRLRSGCRIAVVGNAPPTRDHAARIDTADIVVRFNNAAGFERENGRKVTDLFLVNCGGQMREWLDEPGFEMRRTVRLAERVYFPIHPMTANLYDPPLTITERMQGEAQDWTMEASRRLGSAGKNVQLLPAAFFKASCEAIGTRVTSGMRAPSTGYLATRYFLETMGLDADCGGAGCRVECFGFGFDGWKGHAWDAERRWFEARENEGLLSLVDRPRDVGATGAARRVAA